MHPAQPPIADPAAPPSEPATAEPPIPGVIPSRSCPCRRPRRSPAAGPIRKTGYSRWVIGDHRAGPRDRRVRRWRGRRQQRSRRQRPPNGAPAASGGAGAADLALIEEAWRAIQDNYVDAKHLDDRDLAYGAIRGMTDAVGDEGHTSFMTADEAKAVDQSLSGTFVGIGVQLDTDETKGPIIRSVIPGTPAEEAGLKRGDAIVEVDGTSTDGPGDRRGRVAASADPRASRSR